MARKITKLADLTPDEHNANKGTERGLGLLEASLRSYGAGRSILVDREGRVIAGNKTLQQAAELGLDDLVVVQTDGRKLVAVQRTDLDLESDPAARELAYADNRVAQVDLDWDTAILAEDRAAGIGVEEFWFPEELDRLIDGIDHVGEELARPDGAHGRTAEEFREIYDNSAILHVELHYPLDRYKRVLEHLAWLREHFAAESNADAIERLLAEYRADHS